MIRGVSVTWRALLGDYPATRAFRHGSVTSSNLTLDFADVAVPHKAFKRVVRDMEFDVAELALMTFLIARSRGVPLRLLPIVLFSRNPLNLLVYRTARTVNHVVVVRDEIAANADHVRRLLDLSQRSAGEANPPAQRSFGIDADALTRTLDVAIHTACAQHLLARELTVSDLFA
jgi:hypothetical protein